MDWRDYPLGWDDRHTGGEILTWEQMRENRALLEALCTDDVSTVEKFLRIDGVSPDAHLYYNGGQRPLIVIAVQRNSINVVRLLCRAGCSLTVEDKLDHSKQPLHIAIDRSLKEIALALINEHGADPSACNRNGRNAFHFACLRQEKEILRACVQSGKLRGIDALDFCSTCADQRGYSPMMYLFVGLVQDNEDIAEVLASTGRIDFTRLSRTGETLLEVACKALTLQPRPIRWILKHMKAQLGSDGLRAQLNSRLANGETLLTLLLQPDRPGINAQPLGLDGKVAALTSWLVRDGANVDGPNSFGQTAIFLALKKGYAKTVATLIDAGCSLDVKNLDQMCPLGVACDLGNLILVDMVLESGGFHVSEPCCRRLISGPPEAREEPSVKRALQRVLDHQRASQPPALFYLARDAIRKALRGGWTESLAPYLPSTVLRNVFPILNHFVHQDCP